MSELKRNAVIIAITVLIISICTTAWYANSYYGQVVELETENHRFLTQVNEKEVELTSLKNEITHLREELKSAKRLIEALNPLYDGSQIGAYLSSLGVNDIIVVQRGELWADQIANTLGLNIVQTIRYGAGSEHFKQWEFEEADAILLLAYTDAVELMKVMPEGVPIYGYDGLEYARRLN